MGAWGKHRTVVMKWEVDEWRKLRFLQSANPCPNSQPPLQFTKYSEGLDITWAICLTLYQAKVCLFVKIPNLSGGFSLKEVFKPNILRAIVNRAFPGASCTFTIFIFLNFLQWQIPWGIFYGTHKQKYLNLTWCEFLHYCFSGQSEELWGLQVLSEFFK